MDKYYNNNIKEPTYLFHGSPKKIDIIEQRQSHDSNGNKENEAYAVFLTTSFIIASAYAFKDSIKEISSDLEWEFEIGYDSDNDEPNIKFKNVNIDDELEGYIYVFPFDTNYEHQKGSIQYKSYQNIVPIDIIKIKLEDFKQYYSIDNEQKQGGVKKC